jgi:hypothetical protein
MAKAAALALACGVIATLAWTLIDARTAFFPAGPSMLLTILVGYAAALWAFEFGLKHWHSEQDGSGPTQEDTAMDDPQTQQPASEEDVVAQAIFKAIEPNLPVGSHWRSCLGAAQASIAALDQHRRECGFVSVSAQWLEDLRAKLRTALSQYQP